MAIINSIAVGKGRGKLGNMVLSTTKGRCIAREYNPSILNPKTPAQMAQRNRMKNVVAVYQTIAAGIDKAFINRDKRISVYNAFVKANSAAVAGTECESVTQILAENPILKIANGSLGTVEFKVGSSNEAAIRFDNVKHALKAGDKAVAFAINADGTGLQVIEQELTDAEIQAGLIEFEFVDSGNLRLGGGYLYTADRKKSTSSTMYCEEWS